MNSWDFNGTQYLWEKPIRFGNAADYVQIDGDGELSLAGDATVWEDLRAPATAINPPGQASDPTWDNTNGGWLFDNTGTEQLWVILQIPHAWKVGSSIYPHIHWMPTTATTNYGVWQIDYKWTDIDEVDAGSFTNSTALAYGNNNALEHILDSFAAISGAGHTISSTVTVKISRTSAGNYTGDMLLKEFDIHYEIDTMGSKTESAK